MNAWLFWGLDGVSIMMAFFSLPIVVSVMESAGLFDRKGTMMNAKEMLDKAKALDAEAKSLRDQVMKLHNDELRAKSIADRLVYAAHSRCPCGAGLAFDPLFEDENSVFKGPLSGYWDCSAILLGKADQAVQHTAKLPFSFYEVLSEQQPSAGGATTREPVAKSV